MSMYYPPTRPDELMHWGIKKGEEAKKHKYFARILTGVKNGQNVYRYFYDKKEWDAYVSSQKKNRPTETIEKSNDKKTGDIYVTVDGETQQISEDKKPSFLSRILFGSLGSRLIEAGKEIVNKIIEKREEEKRKAEEEAAEEEIKRQTEIVNNYRSDQEAAIQRTRSQMSESELRAADDKKRIADENGAIEYPEGDDRYKYVAKVPMGDGSFRYFYDRESYTRYLSATGQDDLAESFGVKSVNDGPDELLQSVNPHFEDGREYQTNCFSCTAAYEMNRRGYDVESIPNEHKVDNSLSGIERDYIGVKDTRIRTNMSSDEAAKLFEESCLAQGDGARGVITYCWNGGGGHVNNWEVINGKVYIVDSQVGGAITGRENISDFFSGTRLSQASSSYWDEVDDAPIAWFRTDNLDINVDEMRETTRRR